MKTASCMLLPLVMVSFSPLAFAGANCAQSQSWQCHHNTQQTGGSGPSLPSINPQVGNPTGSVVTPLGGLPTDHHNVMLVPPQPPAQQTPQPMAIVVPPLILPTQRVPPMLVTASGHSTQTNAPTHQLIVHEPDRPRPHTSGHHAAPDKYSFEFIEPGIQNHRVEVYRSRDARQAIYKDTMPLDAGAYHLRVIGIRDPEYIN